MFQTSTSPKPKKCGINRVENRVKFTRFTHDSFSIFSYANELNKSCFYSPVFRRDVLWYGDVRPSVRPSQFSALFSYMLWDIELKFCVSLYFDARKSKFECHEFLSIFARVMPLFNFKYAVFRTFFLHALRYWAEILHMTSFNCNTDQVRMSFICVVFCWSYAPFLT